MRTGVRHPAGARFLGPTRGPSRRLVWAVAVAAEVGVVLLALASVPAFAASTEPAYAGDFPDPFVLAPAAGETTYWAYSTGSGRRNLQVMHSDDLRTWKDLADPLPVLPPWASPGHTWAPGVLRQGDTYLMYYTARHTASGRQCIGLATAQAPGGPFTDESQRPLICQRLRGGSIDPNPFVAPDGTRYLLWKSDDNVHWLPSSLWGQRLSADGRSLTGPVTRLLTLSRLWQAPTIEGPTMVAVDGTYYLFYGANDSDGGNAAIGYAVCRGPLGPCTNASTTGPWMASHDAVVGPSGPAVFTDAEGSTRLAYHAWWNGSATPPVASARCGSTR